MAGYPPAWHRLFAEHKPDIDSGRLAIYNPKDEQNKKRSFAVVFKVPDGVNKEISDILREEVPLSIRNKVLFPPYQGFHFTIQWAPEKYLQQINLADLLPKLKKILNKFTPIKGDLYIPFFGRAGLYGMLKTKSDHEILKIREDVHKLWMEMKLPPGLNPKDYDLAYLSTVRYLRPFSLSEIEELKRIKTQQIRGVNLAEVRIVLNDKFMTPEKTQVIDTVNL